MKKILGAFICVMLGLFGLAFSACTPSYNNVMLSCSTNKIQMAVGETQSFNLTFENAPNGMSTNVHLGNVNNLFSVVSSQPEDNKVFFEIKAIKPGTTTVEILSFEGNITTSFEVEIFEQATSFEAKTNAFVVAEAGNYYTLANQSYFTFLPKGCKEPQMLFTYDNQEVSAIVVEKEQATGKDWVKLLSPSGERLTDEQGQQIKFAQGNIILDAQPLDYTTGAPMTSLSSQEISIQIVPQIQTGDLRLLRKGYDLATATKYYDDANKFVVGSDDVVTIIQNHASDSYLVFEVECDTQDVQMTTTSSLCRVTHISANDTSELETYTSTFGFSKFFSLQGLEVGTETIEIVLKYTQNTTFGQTNYEQRISFNVAIITSPTHVTANNISAFAEEVLIYDNAQSAYEIFVGVLEKTSTFKSVKVSLATKNASGEFVESDEYFDYLYITYESLIPKTQSFEIGYEDFTNNTTNLPLKILAQDVFNETIYLLLTVQPLEIVGAAPLAADVQTAVPLKIKEGIKSFTLQNAYTTQIGGVLLPRMLYVDLEKGAQEFDGFEIINLANIELSRFQIEYTTGDETILQISQIEEQNAFTKKLLLVPHKTGTVSVRVTAQEGYFLDLEFSVVKGLSGATLSVVACDEITSTSLDTFGNINGIEYAFAQPDNITFAITPSANNETLFKIQAMVHATSVANIKKVQGQEVVVNVLGTSNDDVAKVTITLLRQEVSEFFALEDVTDQTQNIVFEVELYVYSPIKSIEFVQTSTGTNAEEITSAISGFWLYRQADVGYRYANLAMAECAIRVVLQNGETIDDVFESFANLSIMTSYGALVNRGGTYFINQFGDFAYTSNSLVFRCNYENAQVGSFVFTITIQDHNTSFSQSLAITVKAFNALEYVGITNYQDVLYLSGTHNSHTFFTYMDQMADIQKFDVVFEPTENKYANLVSVSVNADSSQVLVQHNNAVSNGSGYLYFVPRTMFDQNDNFPKDRVQKIKVVYSDGSDEAFPELISTAQEFMAAMTQTHTIAKHYLILSNIDLAGYTFENIKNLTGTISGGNANAKITNINLLVQDKHLPSGINSYYFGLFPQIEEGAKINDLVFEGSINIAIENLGANKALFAGLVAGENAGQLNNVSVRLQASNITIEDNAESNKIFVGGIVGQNLGTIQNGTETTASKTFLQGFENGIKNVNLVTNASSFAVEYSGLSQDTAVGGVAGKNLGEIKRLQSATPLYNTNNYTQNLNLRTVGIAQTGGIAGQNGAQDNQAAQIVYQAVTGNIDAKPNFASGGKNVGGVCGTNFAKIQNSVVRANISGQDFVGGLAGQDNNAQGVVGNKVQAAKNNMFAPMLKAIANTGNIGAFCGNVVVGYTQSVYDNNSNKAECFYQIDLASMTAPIHFNFFDGTFQIAKQCAFLECFDAITISSIIESPGTQKFDVVSGINANHLANMFIYVAESSSQQHLVQYLNENRSLPFNFVQPDSIIITSLSPEILTVDTYGHVFLHTTGVATLQVQSVLDTSLTQKLFINVSNAFDAFELQDLSGQQLASGAFLNVLSNQPASIQYAFTAKPQTAVGDMGQIVDVKFVNASLPDVQIEYQTAQHYFSTAQKYGNLVIFTSTNNLITTNRQNTVVFTPKFATSFDFDGQTITAQLSDFSSISQNLQAVNLDVISKLGTQSIFASFSNASIEPVDDIEIKISQITDIEDDELVFTCTKLVDSTANDYFTITQSAKSKTFDTQTQTYLIEYDLTITFNYNKYTSGYEGVYYLTFAALNGKSTTIVVELITQNIESLSLKNYYNLDNALQTGGKESNQVASGDFNLLEINLYPYFADYDYILIKNDDANYEKNNVLIMEVVVADANGDLIFLNNVHYLPEGIVVSKQLMSQQKLLGADVSRIFVRYTTVSKATVDTIAKLFVLAYKQGQPQPLVEASLPLNVVVKDTVFFTIDNRQQAEEYYLARGLTYDLSLTIYGFTEDQVKINITHEGLATQAVSIKKTNDKYQLVVAKNITYASSSQNSQGFEVEITTFAENVIDGIKYQSGETTLKVIIVDFVILQENIGQYYATQNPDDFALSTTIANAQGAVVSLPVGNPYTLANKLVLNQTVEYDESNESISQKVQNFEDLLSQNGIWVANAVSVNDGVLGRFVPSMEITNASNLKSDYLRISGKTITPLRINDYQNTKYYFSFAGSYYYQLGQVMFGETANSFALDTHFVFDVYPNSNLENAIPVNNYQEFISMNQNGHYILMSDITLPQDFVPITTQIASFDGNGHTITLPANISFESTRPLGVFELLASGAVLKNVTLYVPLSTTVSILNQTTTIFGALVGENNGIITNCALVGGSYAQLAVTLPNQQSNIQNIISGLVGTNNGFITNSHVSCNISAAGNVSGFVGTNNGKISACFVSESMIINKSSNSSHKTAGFAIQNGAAATTGAAISGCYVKGSTSKISIYSTSSEKAISSMPSVAGLVYTNYATIQDCYSDILINTSSSCAGFVMENSGGISRSYTTSTFSQPGQEAYIFVSSNKIGTSPAGTYQDCFYLFGLANASARKPSLMGLKDLSETEFASSEVFENFAISANHNKTEAIWFWPSKGAEVAFKHNDANMSFTFGRPELVAANILASTQKVLDAENTTTNPQTGETIYAYVETKQPLGTQFNPILIHTAKTFESLILQNTTKNVLAKEFRIISDINYLEESVYISQTHSITLQGVIDGNFMEISGFSIDTRESASAKGLFAQVGGVVKNLVLSPYYLNTPNAAAAGTLAGNLVGGRLFNIVCDGFSAQTEGVKVVGQHAVGGVVGFASGSFKMQNITSSVSANASYNHEKAGKPFRLFQTQSDLTFVSYAGAVVGITHGNAQILNIKASNSAFATAEVCGLLCGHVGMNVLLKNFAQEVTETQFITPMVYGGVVAGSMLGSVQNAEVFGNANADFIKKADIAVLPANAVGTIAGFAIGEILNANVKLDLIWQKITPQVVGGLAGLMLGGTISASTFEGQIVANASNNAYAITEAIVGGLVGKVAGSQDVQTDALPKPKNVVISFASAKGKTNIQLVNVAKSFVGGIVGQVVMVYDEDLTKTELDGTQTVYKTLPKCGLTLNGVQNQMDISVSSIIYGGVLNTYVGGLVGAVFADNTKLYAGEIVVFDKNNILFGEYASTSSANINVLVTDNESSGQIYVWFGGVIGFGNAVSTHTTLLGKFNAKNKPWGILLQTTPNKQSTSPEYLGKWADEEQTERAEFLTTSHMNIATQSPIQGNLQTSFTENQLI